MCLITRQKYAEILLKDLVVYKCLNDDDTSVALDFLWVKDVLIKRDFKIVNTNETDEWFYADDIASDEYWEHCRNGFQAISVGLHACLTIERCMKLAEAWGSKNIKEFLIPKGSEVFYDVTGLVVSNQMMML